MTRQWWGLMVDARPCWMRDFGMAMIVCMRGLAIASYLETSLLRVALLLLAHVGANLASGRLSTG